MKNNTLKKISGTIILILILLCGMGLKIAHADAPAKPTNLSADVGQSGGDQLKVTLHWQDNSSDEDFFWIMRYSSKECPSGLDTDWEERMAASANETSLVCWLDHGGKYYFRVIAVSFEGPHHEAYLGLSECPYLEVDLTTAELYRVQGAAYNQNNEPLGGILIDFYDETVKNHIASTTTDSAGLYSIKLLAGRYKAFANYNYLKTIEPNKGVTNPIIITNTDISGVDFRFCFNCTKIVFVHGAGGNPNEWNQCECENDDNFEVYPFRWSGDDGEKKLREFGNDLNAFIKEKNIDDGKPFIVLAHSFGALIARAAIIRAQEGELENGNLYPMYENVRFVQVAPMIGGDYRAGRAPVSRLGNSVYNMYPTGKMQTWLYDPVNKAKLSRIDIVLATGDRTAVPWYQQLTNPYLGKGLKEDTDGAPILLNDDNWQKPHVNVLNSKTVCSVVKRPDAACGWPPVPSPKPHLVLRTDANKFIKEANGGKIESTLYNVGSDAQMVRLWMSSDDQRIKITKLTASFGTIKTGEEATNTTDRFAIEFTPKTPRNRWIVSLFNFHMISPDGNSGPDYKDWITINTFPILWDKKTSSNSPLSKSIYFARNFLNYISTFGGSESVAEDTPADALKLESESTIMLNPDPDFVVQEAPTKAQRLESQPVLADLDKDGNLEAIVPFAGRQLSVLRSDGTDFWKVPYGITDPGCVAQ